MWKADPSDRSKNCEGFYYDRGSLPAPFESSRVHQDTVHQAAEKRGPILPCHSRPNHCRHGQIDQQHVARAKYLVFMRQNI